MIGQIYISKTGNPHKVKVTDVGVLLLKGTKFENVDSEGAKIVNYTRIDTKKKWWMFEDDFLDIYEELEQGSLI